MVKSNHDFKCLLKYDIRFIAHQSNVKYTRFGAYRTNILAEFRNKTHLQLNKSDFIVFKGKNLSVSYKFIYPIPKSWSKKKKEEFKGKPKNSSPDLTNILKSLEDAVFDFAEIDDKNVVKLTSEKVYNDDIDDQNYYVLLEFKEEKF